MNRSKAEYLRAPIAIRAFMIFPTEKYVIQKYERPWEFKKPPTKVYVQGLHGAWSLLDRLPELGLAVVGTRRPQARVEAFVRTCLLQLRNTSLIIISGLALGIDARAHEAALEAGLPTIAVLGCGLHHQYPPENEDLRHRILESGGLIVSEYEPDEAAKPHYFLCRNRLIAGLSKAVWIAQAPARSGALNTACWARDENRDCYATPCFPGDPSLLGNQILIDDDHARPLWGAHGFGTTWSELSSLGTYRNAKAITSIGKDKFLDQIRCRTAQSGGVTAGDLLDWAMQRGLSPLEFFERLQKAQQCGLVSEKNGVLASS